MKMNRKTWFIILGIIIFTILIIVVFSVINKKNQNRIDQVITKNAKLEDIIYDKNRVNIYLFWGDGCPHCANEYKFLESIVKEYGNYFHVYGFEVWNNEENYKLSQEFAKKMDDNNSGIPLTIVGDKVIRGYNDAEIKQQILSEIINNHKNSKDVYFDKIVEDK